MVAERSRTFRANLLTMGCSATLFNGNVFLLNDERTPAKLFAQVANNGRGACHVYLFTLRASPFMQHL
jgi:hypothetical protein